MRNTQYALPNESIVDIVFQYNSINYNLHINTNVGLITLQTLNKHKPDELLFAKVIHNSKDVN